jgi:hypothetical protein
VGLDTTRCSSSALYEGRSCQVHETGCVYGVGRGCAAGWLIQAVSGSLVGRGRPGPNGHELSLPGGRILGWLTTRRRIGSGWLTRCASAADVGCVGHPVAG